MADKEIGWKPSSVTQVVMADDFEIKSLLSSGSRVGYQSDMIDNTSEMYKVIEIMLTVKVAATALANRAIYVHALRYNGTIGTDGCADTKGALTQWNAPLLGIMRTGATIPTDDLIHGTFMFWAPGRKWGLLLWHDTNVALTSTSTDHKFEWTGLLPEIQDP